MVHLKRYRARFQQTTPARVVAVLNQFGRARLRVDQPTDVMVPASKAFQPFVLPPAPNNLGFEQFVCRDARKLGGAFKQRIVTVLDQFRSVTLTVRGPKYLCNPAEKRFQRVEPIRDPTRHLVCCRVHATSLD